MRGRRRFCRPAVAHQRPIDQPGSNVTSNPVERLTAERQLAPAAALSDLPYTGMAVMRWTCRTALKREFVSQVGDDVHVFSYVLRNWRASSWLDGRQVWDGVIPTHGLWILAPAAEPRWFAHSAFDSMQFHVPVDAVRDMADAQCPPCTGSPDKWRAFRKLRSMMTARMCAIRAMI